MRTFGEDDIMFAERVLDPDVNTWQHIVMPPRGMAKIKKIVLSQGLELDNLRIYMEFPVVTQYVRVQPEDLEGLKDVIGE